MSPVPTAFQPSARIPERLDPCASTDATNTAATAVTTSRRLTRVIRKPGNRTSGVHDEICKSVRQEETGLRADGVTGEFTQSNVSAQVRAINLRGYVRALVTGGGGFIGSHLVDRLLQLGHDVVIFDNFSTGQRAFIGDALRHRRATLIEADTLDMNALGPAMRGCETVFHLAANADVRFGTEHPRKDLEQNTIATFNVLEAMREHGARRIAFASTGSIYGDATEFPTSETAPFPIQTSLYGASKLAGEGLIEAYCEGFGFEGYIFRFVSILGERYSHGHVFDFYKSLRANPGELRVLGNGLQKKSYLYVGDCLDAILTVMDKVRGGKAHVFNLGTDEYCEVNDSIRLI